MAEKKIGRIGVYDVVWDDVNSDGGMGTGEVWVGVDKLDSRAQSEAEAMNLAQRHYDKYETLNGR